MKNNTRKPKLVHAGGTPVVPADTSAPVVPAETGIVTTDAPVAPVAPVVEPVRPFDVATFTETALVAVSSPDGTRSAVVPVSAAIARIACGIRAIAGIAPGDTPELFAARVAAFRAAYDAGHTETVWSGIGFNRSAIGASVMDTQNTIYAACVVSGVAVSNAGIMAAWRAMIPATKCPFESRRYGVSALADLASGRARPTSVATVPAASWSGVFAAWYATDGYRKPWTVAPAPVAE